jgi:hypothetical protein
MTETTHFCSFDFFFDICRLRYLMKTTYNDYDATVALFVSAMTEPTHSRSSDDSTTRRLDDSATRRLDDSTTRRLDDSTTR